MNHIPVSANCLTLMGVGTLVTFAVKGLKKSICLAKSTNLLQDIRRVEEGDGQEIIGVVFFFSLCLLLKPELARLPVSEG